ncbi:type III polyketide synthase [Cryobacterium gelidum]|uniref:Type III polyketide synthase n=1 Tax=Cryobacterium gelidum TaxID=1259164 RepID=A0A4R9AXZ0_9MICO|nr:type III polyketide synthase [Cryobacterium gelidum]TFD72318.1 type III polyketide synthase [Cryobacterium gelidum]
MAVTLRALQTVVPPTILIQEQVRDIFAAQPGLSRLAQRLVSTSFNVSGIETRHTVIDELTLDNDAAEPQFFDARQQLLLVPSTRVRNELYITEATKLFVEAGRRALAACPDIRPEDVTHVVTVSCTGFYAPGPDFMLVRELGLQASTQRYHLGFMGCYAAMPALRTAKQFVEADPTAVVLVVSAELCSLHLRTSSDPDTIVASSLFSDGAAAGIVSARAPLPGEKALGLDLFETVITPIGEGDMAWKIGDEGFEMILSTYVPHIIDEHIEGALAPLFARDASITAQLADALPAGVPDSAAGAVATLLAPVLTLAPTASLSSVIEHWAIHPGGRSILDKTEAKLELRTDQLIPSRETLRTNGNMSSATILFVMKAILDGPATADGERVCAMAFGPGLTVESGLMTVIEG